MTWRSLLYVPVTQRRFVEKALTVGAGAQRFRHEPRPVDRHVQQ